MVIVIMRVLSFQSTLPPKASPTKRKGARVRSFLILAGTSRGHTCPFTIGRVEPIDKTTVVFPLTEVTVRVLLSQFTLAPMASNIALRGTKVRPFSITGGTSKVNCRPSSITCGTPVGLLLGVTGVGKVVGLLIGFARAGTEALLD